MQKIGISHKLQPSLLKQGINHDKVFEYTWEVKKLIGCLMSLTTFYQLLSVMLGSQNAWKSEQDSGSKTV